MARSAHLTLASILVLLVTLAPTGAPAGCADADEDGFCDGVDNCPNVANPHQTDTDGDLEGDACDLDDDHDGTPDESDNCPLIFNYNQADADDDGMGNRCDPCRDVPGIDCSECNCPFGGCSPCPGDFDCDGVRDESDSCPCVYNTGQFDSDNDGIGDRCDSCVDSDGDGYGEIVPGYPADPCGADNCPHQPNPTQADFDNDGIGNSCDNCHGDPSCGTPCPSQNSCEIYDEEPPFGGGGNCFEPGAVCLNTGCFPGHCECQDGFWSCNATCHGQCYVFGCSDPEAPDPDGDNDRGICDNCPTTPNPGQGDVDADDVGDACDNCVGTLNPGQGDADGDGFGNLCDIANGVILVGFETGTRAAWGTLDDYDSFNLYRGDLGLLRSTGNYTQEPGGHPSAMRLCGLSDLFVDDSDSPAGGDVAFYLVTGNSGGSEWGLGAGSGGAIRPHQTSCETLASEMLCVATGGTWDIVACGDYDCGSPQDCTAVIPGCDCGSDANFVPGTGCVEDPSCP